MVQVGDVTIDITIVKARILNCGNIYSAIHRKGRVYVVRNFLVLVQNVVNGVDNTDVWSRISRTENFNMIFKRGIVCLHCANRHRYGGSSDINNISR